MTDTEPSVVLLIFGILMGGWGVYLLKEANEFYRDLKTINIVQWVMGPLAIVGGGYMALYYIAGGF